MSPGLVVVLASGTIRELARDKVFSGALVTSALLAILALPLGRLSLGQDIRILADLGFAAIEVTTVLLMAWSGAQMMARKWERRTAVLVLSKPVDRGTFLLGKALGLMGTGTILVGAQSVWLLTLLALAGARTAPLLADVPLLWLQAMVVAALAMGFSAATSAPVTLLATLTLYVVGHNLDSVMGLATQTGEPTRTLLATLCHALPDFSLLDLKNRVVHGQSLAPAQWGLAFGHGLAWIAMALAGGVALFHEREI